MQRIHPVPRKANTIGMWLFLVSLGMLFLASMLGYVLIRINNSELSYGSVKLPTSLWVSTALMLAGSVSIHQALLAIRRERHDAFRTWLTTTIVFAALFCIVQTPAMIKLWQEHSQMMDQWHAQQRTQAAQPLPPPQDYTGDERILGSRSVPFYALVMVLILIHALHVVGGIISLGFVVRNAYLNRYDHENYAGVQNCVLYWHFLDIVWIVMFTVIAAFG